MPTLRIDNDRWAKLEAIAVKKTIEDRKLTTVPEIVRGIIDERLSREKKLNKDSTQT